VRLLLTSSIAFAAIVMACSSDTSSTAPTVTTVYHYKADIFPIFSANCALAACHGSSESPQGVHFDQGDPEATYQALMKPSQRFTGTNLVEPGDPDNSLVMRKMDGTQAQLASCPAATKCGTSMPPPDDPSDTSGAQLLSQKKRDKVRAWIKDGAKDD
jgi:hypothetical protein